MAPKKFSTAVPSRTTALCYVRLSMTRDESDLNSPERQRANIKAECDRRGWQPEWYEDADGHKSGTKEENRPGWMALKARLNDPDVVAIVSNDLSRLHRKGWRVGSLLDMLEEHEIGLVLAAPGRNMDFTGPTGKINTMLIALMDEYYAMDTSQKQKDSVHYRRSKGIIVGPVPFGTTRNKEGYLQRSTEGVWLMPDSTFVEGQEGQPVPDGASIWRGFADATRRCLELYTQNTLGRRKIAEMLNAEGYRYRDSVGNIIPFKADDVRRITANWVEYGGAVIVGKAKNRRAKEVTPETVVLHPEHAVFDVELCYQVGYVRRQRTRDMKRIPDYVVKIEAKVYPLSKLVYCAHCERAYFESEDSSLRSYLTGKTGNKPEARRYRHENHHHCAAKAKSVSAALLEADFFRLLESLSINPEALPMLTEALEKINKLNRPEEYLAAIQADMALWRQRIKNVDTLFMKARVSEEEWRVATEEAEHEITRLQAQMAERREAEIALTLTMKMVADLIQSWHQANPETRRSLAHGLFEEIIYDLDEQKIVDFKLKPWAELLMQLKVTFDPDPTPSPDSGTISDENQRVFICSQRDSNPRRQVPKTCALTTELWEPLATSLQHHQQLSRSLSSR